MFQAGSAATTRTNNNSDIVLYLTPQFCRHDFSTF